MPKLDKEYKTQISLLSHKEKDAIIFKYAAKDKLIYNYIYVNYVDREHGEQELFELCIEDVKKLFVKGYKGYSQQLRLVNMMIACIKRINEFQKICKNRNLEADLLILLLDEVFSYSSKHFGTYYRRFDSKVGTIVKRLINLINIKLHPDFKIEYEDKVNEYLNILHSKSDHIPVVEALPKAL
jgi:hypothetical protein